MKYSPYAVQTVSLPTPQNKTNAWQLMANWLPKRHSLRMFIRRHRRLLVLVRILSAVFWLGPWCDWAIRLLQKRNANPLLRRSATSYFSAHSANAIAQLVAQLEADGFAQGWQLSHAPLEEISAYAAAHPTRHHHNPHLTCPAINHLVHDPQLLTVAKSYLGAEPRLYSTQMYWTLPPANEQQRQMLRQRKACFHYDLGDFKALNVFFYLTDVNADCGPHVVIPGTQRGKSWRQLLSRYLNDEEAQTLYGDRITTVLGPRGSSFFENLACYHKHSFGTRERLMLSLTYVLQRTPEAPAAKLPAPTGISDAR